MSIAPPPLLSPEHLLIGWHMSIYQHLTTSLKNPRTIHHQYVSPPHRYRHSYLILCSRNRLTFLLRWWNLGSFDNSFRPVSLRPSIYLYPVANKTPGHKNRIVWKIYYSRDIHNIDRATLLNPWHCRSTWPCHSCHRSQMTAHKSRGHCIPLISYPTPGINHRREQFG